MQQTLAGKEFDDAIHSTKDDGTLRVDRASDVS